MAIKSFYSQKEQDAIIVFLGKSGQNYERYYEFVEANGWRHWSKFYFNKWYTRHSDKIKIARAIQRESIQKISTFDRPARIDELERTIDQIKLYLRSSGIKEHVCKECNELHNPLKPELFLRMIAQKSKLLEQIAKEKNEWMKEAKVDEPDLGRSIRDYAFRSITENQEKEDHT
jgi:hypothetical protein